MSLILQPQTAIQQEVTISIFINFDIEPTALDKYKQGHSFLARYCTPSSRESLNAFQAERSFSKVGSILAYYMSAISYGLSTVFKRNQAWHFNKEKEVGRRKKIFV